MTLDSQFSLLPKGGDERGTALHGAKTAARECLHFVNGCGTKVGELAILQHSFNWKQLSLIAGVTFWRFYFRFFPGAIKAPQLVEFLKALTQQIDGKLLIVWDGLPAHRSRLVRAYVESLGDRIVLERLPAYAPELNPVEYLFGYTKQRVPTRAQGEADRGASDDDGLGATKSPKEADGVGRFGGGVSGAHNVRGVSIAGRNVPDPGTDRTFISYVAAHPRDEEPDPDGLDRETRMNIEDEAISKIIAKEPSLIRTPEGNPGFDLYEVDAAGKPVRWVEVKSMTGSLRNRPVGLSSTQFEFARERGPAYWLYIVEHATDGANTRILRIRDPVAKARTFTFDRGWAEIAIVDA